MSHILQKIRKSKFLKASINKNGLKLDGNPQKKAICIKAFSISPKKPNSANRKIAKIKFSNTKNTLHAKIIGEKHNLQSHSIFLVKGGRSRDLVGVHLKAIRGTYDLSGLTGRQTSRSLYGTKKQK
jgi:small subunit ribosomal protein S12